MPMRPGDDALERRRADSTVRRRPRLVLPSVLAVVLPASMIAHARAAPRAAQVPFESVVSDLGSGDRAVRLRAVQLLKDTAYVEAALPLAPLVTDGDDEIQLEAIAAELNIFLVEKTVTRRRVGLVVEVRNRTAAETAFSQGPLAIGAHEVPLPVLVALRAAAADDNLRVAVEALYAFGTLAAEPAGDRRRTMLREIAPELKGMIASPRVEYRYAALRVAGRVFDRRSGDEPVDPSLGDAIVGAVNDRDRNVRGAAIQALGALRIGRAIAALTDQFRYFRRGQLAESALEALARIGHSSSAPLFLAELGSKDPALKALAIEGLVRIGDQSPKSAIEMALAGDSDDRVALAGSFASVMLGGTPIDPLIEALRKPRVAARARAYLVELAPGRAALFARYAQDPDIGIRAGVADVLGLAGDPTALAIVAPMRQDRDQQVALAAARAVARLTR